MCPSTTEDPDAGWANIDWDHHTRDLTVDGRRVRYVDMGSGDPLVLIHGQGGCWQWWLRNIPILASQFRVIAIDLAGFGASDPIAAGPVIDGQISTVTAVMDHLAVSSYRLVGHSMGGLVAMEVARTHPGRVHALVLVDAGGSNLGKTRLRLIVSGFRLFNALFSVPWVPGVVARQPILRRLLFAAAVTDGHCVSASLAAQIVPRMATPGFMASMRAAAAAVATARPEGISCPTLVVWGSHDRILPLSAGRLLASRIPAARFAVVDGVGHCVMFEAPDEFNRLLLDAARADSRRSAG